MAKRGVLLALEGIDGCGKSTQAELLAAALRERGLEVVLTCEPTDSPLGQQIREYFQGPDRYLSPKEELNLFMADRREHVAEVIDPALAEGKIVICDRYYYSSVAYQGALGLETRDVDAAADLVVFMHYTATAVEVAAERAFLRRLGGGCQIPVGARASVAGPDLEMTGVVADPDGRKLFRGQIKGPAQDGEKLGQELAERLLREGAEEVLVTKEKIRAHGLQ